MLYSVAVISLENCLLVINNNYSSATVRPGAGLHDRRLNFLSSEDEGNNLRGFLRESGDVGAGVDHLEISKLFLLYFIGSR